MSQNATKRLIVMRHGEAEASSFSVRDHQRKLTSFGQFQANSVAQQLKVLGWIPQVILYSDAMRTTETASAIRSVCSDQTTFIPVPQFFMGGPAEISEEVGKYGIKIPQADCILVVGHNPSWSLFASILSGESIHLSTADTVLMEHQDPDWRVGLALEGTWNVHSVLSV